MYKRRFSKQSQQEQISRYQLSERLVTIGWVPVSPSPDLGEDFIAHIYFDGQASGVTFHIQEKSVIDLQKLKKGEMLACRLKVADLLHWAPFSLPVVVIIWDIKQKEGRWQFVSEIVKTLEKDSPRWRECKKVTVRIPWNHTTDDKGLSYLKWEIGRFMFPLLSIGKELNINMSLAFPDTEDGKAALNAYERFLKEGEPTTLKGEVIQSLKFSDWWQKWFDDYDHQKVEIQLGRTAPDINLPISTRIISKNGSASISNLELRAIQSGTELIKFTNEHQTNSLFVRLDIRRHESRFTYTFNVSLRNIGSNIQETKTVLDFFSGIASGGTLAIELLESKEILTTKVLPNKKFTPDPYYLGLIEKLCVIQDKTGQFIRLPDAGISKSDNFIINRLFEIVTTGRAQHNNAVMTLGLKGEALQIILEVHKINKPLHFTMELFSSSDDLFGLTFQTGHLKREVFCTLDVSAEEFEAQIKQLSADEFISVKFVKANVVDIFSDYMNS